MKTSRVSSKLTQCIYTRNDEEDLDKMSYVGTPENPRYSLHKILSESKTKSPDHTFYELREWLHSNLNNSFFESSAIDIYIVLMNLSYLLKQAKDQPNQSDIHNFQNNDHVVEVIGYSAAHLALVYAKDLRNKNLSNQPECANTFISCIANEIELDKIHGILLNQENSFSSMQWPIEVKDDSHLLYRSHFLKAIFSHFPKLTLEEANSLIFKALKKINISEIHEYKTYERTTFLADFIILLYLTRKSLTSQMSPQECSYSNLQDTESLETFLTNEQFIEFAHRCFQDLPKDLDENAFLFAVLGSTGNSVIDIISDCSESSLTHASNFFNANDLTSFEFEQICRLLKRNENCSSLSKVLFIQKIIDKFPAIKLTVNALSICMEMIYLLPEKESDHARLLCSSIFSNNRIDCESSIDADVRNYRVIHKVTKKFPDPLSANGFLTSLMSNISETLELCCMKFKLPIMDVQSHEKEIATQLLAALSSPKNISDNNKQLFYEITLTGFSPIFDNLDLDTKTCLEKELKKLNETNPYLQKLLIFDKESIKVTLIELPGNFSLSLIDPF